LSRTLVPLNTNVRPSPESERPLIERLLDSYLRELSAHRDTSAGARDAVGYRHLPYYWLEADRFPFTLRSNGQVAGFALLRRVARAGTPVMHLAEFYVSPAFRRRGIGRTAVTALWDRYPGPWELQVHVGNAPARAFWRGCIEAHAAEGWRVEETSAPDGRRLQYSFDIPARRRA
jgi:predicted acetyltransferase